MPNCAVTTEQHHADLESLKADLLKMSRPSVMKAFVLDGSVDLIKTTISVCQHCLSHAPAAVYELEQKVWLKANCKEHGLTENLLENDADYYRLSNKDKWGVAYNDAYAHFIPEYSGCCETAQNKTDHSCAVKDNPFSNQLTNKSCTILIEITNACNLACRVCYADASGDRILPFEEFKGYVGQLIEQKDFIDSIQITGGEAAIHPRFNDMVEWLFQQDKVGLIYLPTNGLEFSKPEVIHQLKKWRKKLLILLQFDGHNSNTNMSLRRANTLKQREQVIKLLAKNKICMQLTMTVAHQLSEYEIAWVMQQGLKYKHIRLIGFLPTFYTGRYQLEHNGQNRPTLSTVVKAIVQGISKKVKSDDFMPIPCSHPNCGWTTLFARRFGLLFNITQKIDMEAVMNEVAYKTVLDKNEIQAVLSPSKTSRIKPMLTNLVKKIIRPKDVFGVAIKPFMDQYNYDMDRVSNCCHHILDTNGQLVSFCEYNTRLRMKDSWDGKPKISGPHQKVALAIKQKMDG